MPSAIPVEVLGSQVPRIFNHSPETQSDYSKYKHLLKALNLEPMPWQDLVLEHALCTKQGGKFAHSTVGLVVPRQNGKSWALAIRQILGLLILKERKQVHSAHEHRTSKEHYLLIEKILRDAGYDEKKVKYRFGNAETSIEILSTGCKLLFTTRTNDGGRGLSGDVVYLDEAFALEDSHIEALLPIMSSKALKGNPQVWFSSSAGKASSDVLKKVRDRGIGKKPGVLYMEWSAEHDCNIADLDNWAQANPALGYSLSVEWTREQEFEQMSAEGFGRERLGIWSTPASTSTIFTPEQWSNLVIPVEDAPTASQMVLAVDVSPDRSYASVALALTPEGTSTSSSTPTYVELVARDKGTDWLAGYCRAFCAAQPVKHVLVDSRGPASSVIALLQVADVPVKAMGTKDVLNGCAGFYDAVIQQTITHTGDDVLTQAVESTGRRAVGDAFAWKKVGPNDIAPANAVTFAWWGAQQLTYDAVLKPSKPSKVMRFAR